MSRATISTGRITMATDGYGHQPIDAPAWVTRLVAIGALIVAVGMCYCAAEDAGDFPAVDTRPVAEATK
jgi:UDP-N-acetyl-D-mannosaminuronic acid transferase (WecB/TagA/CpsF family)